VIDSKKIEAQMSADYLSMKTPVLVLPGEVATANPPKLPTRDLPQLAREYRQLAAPRIAISLHCFHLTPR
jgi:hypothetical protein